MLESQQDSFVFSDIFCCSFITPIWENRLIALSSRNELRNDNQTNERHDGDDSQDSSR